MKLYIESSAVLAWLLAEPAGDAVRREMATATVLYASQLTTVEVSRTLVVASHRGRISKGDAIALGAQLAQATGHWDLIEMDASILDRARQPFPEEPIRTLDAIHLASALEARAAAGDLALLSLDDRVRRSGRALGFDVRPPSPA